MASPTHLPHQNASSADWTLAEKIRLLELYTDKDKDMLWDQRCDILKQEFAKRRSPDFFSNTNVRQELHRIFSKPNPEHHICGMPIHPRGKEAAELWLKHFRKEYAELIERKKQMFAVAIRRHMDLIHRYQQGKVTAEEMEAILTEQRQKDAQRADSEIYEAKIKEAIDKLDPDGLKNIRSTEDYVNYVRGDRIPSPPPIQSKFDQQIPTLASPTRSFGSPEPVLKAKSKSPSKSPIKTPTTSSIAAAISNASPPPPPPTFTISPANNEKEEEEGKETTSLVIAVPRKRLRVNREESILVHNPPPILTRGREKRQSTSGTTTTAEEENTTATETTSAARMTRKKHWAQGQKEVAQEASTNMQQAEMASTRERRTSQRKEATPKKQQQQEEEEMEEEKEKEKTLMKEEEEMTTAVETTENVVVQPKSKKRKRGELDLLTTAASGIGEQQIPAEDSLEAAGPPSKNLRRSSHQLSPMPSSAATLSASTSPSTTANIPVVQQSPKPEIPAVQSPPPKLEPMPREESPPPTLSPFVIPEELQEPPVLSRIAINTKLRSSLRRAALATSTPSPAVDSIGENGLFLRPGNHTSNEIIPRQVLLTLWNDIRAHRYTYVFDQPVREEEVPGYHSAIKMPMDLRTLKTRIESGAVQTFGQFSQDIFLMFANACMYNSTGHHVNSYAREMLAYALKCIQVVQYPSGMWAQTHPLSIGATGGGGGGTVSRQSNASGSDAGDGRISRSSTATTSTNATKSTSQQPAATPQRTNRRSTGGGMGIGGGEMSGGGNEQRKSSVASIKQEMMDDLQLQPSTSSSTPPTKAIITRSGSGMELEEAGTSAAATANISATKRRTSQRRH